MKTKRANTRNSVVSLPLSFSFTTRERRRVVCCRNARTSLRVLESKSIMSCVRRDRVLPAQRRYFFIVLIASQPGACAPKPTARRIGIACLRLPPLWRLKLLRYPELAKPQRRRGASSSFTYRPTTDRYACMHFYFFFCYYSVRL